MPIRLILHAPTPAAVKRARSNARNLLIDEPTAEYEIVVNASGVAEALATADPDTDANLVLCRNSLRRQNLQPDARYRTVPAAVGHIARRQMEGWQYLRA